MPRLSSSALAVLFFAVSQLPVVRSEYVRTLCDSTQSQESKSEFYAAMRIRTHLDNTLYLSSLWSDLSCVAELVIADSKSLFLPLFASNRAGNQMDNPPCCRYI